MNISGIIALLQTIVTSLPGAITTVTQLVDLGTKFFETVNGRAPTADEIAELEKSIDADVIIALSSLPDPQVGDPDYPK